MADKLNWSDEFSTKYGQAVARAWADPGYKDKLLGEPHSALADVGIHLPSDVNLEIFEGDTFGSAGVSLSNPSEGAPGTMRLEFPPPPEGELSDFEFAEVTGGAIPFCFCCCCCTYHYPGG